MPEVSRSCSTAAGSTKEPKSKASAKSAAKPTAPGKSAAKTSSPAQKLRVLALHGHAQSASRFKGKIAAVTKEAKSLAEFEFVDGPFPVPHCEHSIENELGSAFTWIDVSQVGEGKNGVWTRYADIDKSFEFILRQQCDAIVAFSLSAAVLAALLCHPTCGPELRKRLRFVAFFSGFSPSDPKLKSWIEDAGTIRGLPSFHCIGANDEIIAADRSELLASRFDGATYYRHDGGHVVPAAMRKDFKQFLQSISSE
eukprot:TRINITY_DN6834_c0_g1_i2.p1 TRINITY_DN6834_c0_g1~~TRINITY_DN6834_c0_g1_i2.p1  ORF type:complete len:254 (+),score=55.55 TRINITY_DN6834_c0_g1_i2:187-948(+)